MKLASGMTRIGDNRQHKPGFWNTFPSRAISLKRIVIFLLLGILISMPEDVLDSVLTLAHYAFEGFELLLEEVIQHVFHVDKTQSQLYVFYILLAMALGLLVLAYRKGPTVLARLTDYLQGVCRRQKEHCLDIWHEQPLLQRILFITVYLPLFLYFASFLVM